MVEFGHNEIVKIDKCHSDLIFGLLVSQKPESILEFGIGGGQSTDSILKAIEDNQKKPRYVLVDNWCDFGGICPQVVLDKYASKLNLITSSEEDYTYSCKEKFDFIFSDGDHNNANKWFEYTYENILKENGILIYHDISLSESDFPNLREIYNICLYKNIHHILFNKNNKANERCQRGLLVIFKHQDKLNSTINSEVIKSDLNFTVISSATSSWKELQDITSKSLREYAKINNYQLQVDFVDEFERPASWYKVKKILKSFENNNDFSIWVDCDACIVNKSIKLESFVENGKDLYISKDKNGINCGVFMLRNNKSSIDLLNAIWKEEKFINRMWWEQAALMSLIRENKYPESKIKYLPKEIFNAYNHDFSDNSLIYHLPGASYHTRLERFKKVLGKKVKLL